MKLNDDKTEVLLIQTKNSLKSFESPSIPHVGNEDIPFSASARNLGYIISDNMSLDTHVMSVCRSAYCASRQISSVRRFLTTDGTKTLVCVFVLSRLDYCNSLLSNAPKYSIDKLQRVQNCAARLIVQARKSDHITPIFKSLHWLSIEAGTEYKLCVICHNYFSGLSPAYLSCLLNQYMPSRNLRSSSDSRILNVQRVRTKMYGEQSLHSVLQHGGSHFHVA